MIDSIKFVERMKLSGLTKGAGVPCSFMSGLIDAAIANGCYENFNNEGDALAYVSGWSAGKKDEYGFCLMQNSGLSNALSPLTSLNPQFKIPVLLFISWRGQPGTKDEPQHSIMGPKLEDMLIASECRYEILDSEDIDVAMYQVEVAINYMKIEKKPYAFIIKKNTFAKIDKSDDIEVFHEHLISREEALQTINHIATDKNIPVVCTTGQTGRQLHDIHDADNYLYMVGSMGCGQALAAGLSESLNKKVIFVDGDGALMMRLGSCANLAKMHSDVLHIILDNNSYNTTGRQECISKHVDIAATLEGLGYNKVIEINPSNHNQDMIFNTILFRCICLDNEPTPTAIILRIQNDEVTNLGRPSRSPEQKLVDFRRHYGIDE